MRTARGDACKKEMSKDSDILQTEQAREHAPLQRCASSRRVKTQPVHLGLNPDGMGEEID